MYNTEFPLTLRATTLSSGEDVNAFSVIYAETWYHIAVTYDNTDSLKMYLNGRIRRKNRRIIVGPYEPDTTMSLRIGGYAWYPNHGPHVLKGEIDDLRIWDYARSQEEIASAMHEKLTGNESGLAAYWDFDNQADSTILDLTPNGNDGIVHGNARLVDSDAPVGFVPPPAPVGLRAYGGTGVIDLAWKPGEDSEVTYELYRGDSSAFAMDSSTLIATFQAPASTYSDANIAAGQNYYYRLRAIDQEGHHSVTESTAMGRMHTVQNDYLTGVYYYPWYWSTDWEPIPPGWPGYFRYYLQPKQPPMLGYYNSYDRHAIRQHLEWMRSYGIDFMVIDWAEGFLRNTVKHAILPELAGTNIRFALFHSANTFQDSVTSLVTFDNEVEEHLAGDFIYFADNFFYHPNYLIIDGRPAVFLYLSGMWLGNYVQAFDRIRSDLQARGYNLYLVGDEGNFNEIDSEHMQFVDAVSPYIIVDNGYPIDTDFFGDLSVGGGRVDRINKSTGIPLIPNVNPGSGARHLDSAVMNFPRQSTAGAASTSTLEEYIKVMRPFVDPQLNMIMITSWNEWWEDTQIEPTIVAPPTTRDISGSETFYTDGFSYEGYGFKALEVVQDLLASGLVLPTIDHFTYTAQTGSTYSISVSEALLNGESLEEGDEIAVYDRDLCVGAAAVTGDWPLGFWAWLDNSATTATDGFVPGNTMIFWIWDASVQQIFPAAATFTAGNGNFGSGTYAQVSMDTQVRITKPDSSAEVTIADDSSMVSFAFIEGGSLTISFTGGEVAGDTVSVTQLENAPSEVPTAAAFDHPLYYLDIETTGSEYNATLYFGYTANLLQTAGVSKGELGAAYWDGNVLQWKSVPVTVDTVLNTVTITTDHLSLWALVATSEELITGIESAGTAQTVSDHFSLAQNYPNPFNPTTTIRFNLPKSCMVTLKVFNLLGREIETLISGQRVAGEYQVKWTAEGLTCGIYLYRLTAGDFIETKKLILQR